MLLDFPLQQAMPVQGPMDRKTIENVSSLTRAAVRNAAVLLHAKLHLAAVDKLSNFELGKPTYTEIFLRKCKPQNIGTKS